MHLHINLAKDAYCATNRKDKYTQMTTWLEHHEKVQQHLAVIKQWQEVCEESTQIPQPIGPPQLVVLCMKMALHPSSKAISFGALANSYGAVDFQDTLADFIAQTNHPRASVMTLRGLATDTLIPFHAIPVYHKIKFHLYGHPNVVDTVHIRPEQQDSRGCQIPSRFDMVLVCQDGMHGMFQ